ncbi:MAG: tetraacyldisaccharide 4'-kinase [Acidobacteria bacterium]|nr:tetraacyldisaccharide 4'-kinase [Acidobacteriota bacterium]
MYLLYRTLQILAFPLIVLYLTRRVVRDRRYWRGLSERLGFLPAEFRQAAPGAIWVHAVSVGEVFSAVELLRRLREKHAAAPLFVSTATLAGRAAAEQKLEGMADGVFFAPLDFCFAVRRVLRALRPKLLVVMETEIWPNLWREAKRTGCGLLVVNGRISDRAWPRYRKRRWFFRPVLGQADAILAQNEISRARYLELGAPAENIRVGGNLKYDFDAGRARATAAVAELVQRAGPKEIVIAASTMPPAGVGDVDEDELFREWAARHQRLLLMLAPRRPERFETAAQALARAGVEFVRRSAVGPGTELRLPGVLLVDTIGELAGLFRLADVVFMGGTLARRGGHNILEPAFFSRAIVIGPHMENFPDIAEKFRAGGAVEECTELAPAVERLLGDAERRAELGRRARELAAAEQGATARALAEIGGLYEGSMPRHRPACYRSLWLLSGVWLAGVSLKRWYWRGRSRRLATPVISVGGLAAGGVGKSPLVLWLAERLKASGYRPAVLTRGYRRRTRERVTILEEGTRAPVAVTGDEAASYLGVGPVGISADRYAAGRLIEERYRPDVFLLDDGFQHWRLARSLEVAVIDGLDPFAGGAPLPLGRLREPPEALARADAVVISRAPAGGTLEAEIRKYNAVAPVFSSRVAAEAWVDAATEERRRTADLPIARVGAFCGLGNPASFWKTLAELGCRPMFRAGFPDHHAYRIEELRALAARGAQALLTTEKDYRNLPANWREAVAPLRLWWLKIGLEVERADDLLELVKGRIGAR